MLRVDYLAIATLGISEIIIYVLKFEDWLSRGVKHVNGLPRPVPYEVDLQAANWFVALADDLNLSLVDASSLVVKICYAVLFTLVLLTILWLSETALRSPWGRMMRAIRDNETAANAMGKNVTKQHLLVFVLGSAVIGVAGAMLISGLPQTHWPRLHILESAAHTRLMTMGAILILVLRFSPRGLIPEARR